MAAGKKSERFTNTGVGVKSGTMSVKLQLWTWHIGLKPLATHAIKIYIYSPDGFFNTPNKAHV